MTTDTQLAPTDAELMDLGHECELDAIAYGRAVLAKWGAQPVVRKPLTLEQIEAINTRTLGHLHFASAIESEVRKRDEALIRQLVDALGVATTPLVKDRQEVLRAISAGRARLDGKLFYNEQRPWGAAGWAVS